MKSNISPLNGSFVAMNVCVVSGTSNTFVPLKPGQFVGLRLQRSHHRGTFPRSCRRNCNFWNCGFRRTRLLWKCVHSYRSHRGLVPRRPPFRLRGLPGAPGLLWSVFPLPREARTFRVCPPFAKPPVSPVPMASDARPSRAP